MIIAQASESSSYIHISIVTNNYFAYSASPSYSSEEIHRHVLLLSQKSSHEITVHCPIKPGAMKDRYQFQWRVVNLHAPWDTTLFEDKGHSISANISHNIRYQCTATVIHSEGQKHTYDGPVIHIHSHGEVCVLNNAHLHYGNTRRIYSFVCGTAVNI